MSYFSQVQLFDPDIPKSQRGMPLGAEMMAQFKRLVGINWPSGATGIDTNFWTFANSGAGSSGSVANELATLVSGTANNGYASYTSVRPARFRSGEPNLWRGALRITATDGALTSRRWGPFSFGVTPAIQNGYYFNYDGSTSTLSVNAVNNGAAPTTVSSGAFNGASPTYVLDTNAHLYEVLYITGSAWFYIDNVLIHRLTITTPPLFAQINLLNISMLALNGPAGVTSVSIESASTMIARLSVVDPTPVWRRLATLSASQLKLSPGTLSQIIVNNPGSTANTVTIYDGIGVTANIISVLQFPISAQPISIPYGIDFYQGLYVVLAGGTSADITVVYI